MTYSKMETPLAGFCPYSCYSRYFPSFISVSTCCAEYWARVSVPVLMAGGLPSIFEPCVTSSTTGTPGGFQVAWLPNALRASS